MPIRFRDQAVNLGRLSPTLENFAPNFDGTAQGLATFTGTISRQLQPFTGALVGQYQAISLKTGTIGTTLSSATMYALGVTTQDVTAPDAPPAPIVTFYTENSISLSFVPSTAPDHWYWRVYRSTTGPSSGFTLVHDNETGGAWQDTGLTPSTTYWYRLIDVDFAGNQSVPGASVPQQTAAAGGLATSEELTASLVASITSGPAPLAVHFDATATTDDSGNGYDEFRQYGYFFDYDEPGLGNWDYRGAATNHSKNEDWGGPIGSHVFETPGTYDVRVRVRDPLGNVEDAQVTITVQDPDVVYAGGSTVHIPVSNGSWPTWANNTRYTLDAGGNYSGFGAINWANRQNSQLLKVGAGANPVVGAIQFGFNATGPWTSNCSFVDLAAAQISIEVSASYILFHRCSTSGGQLDFGTNGDYYRSQGNTVEYCHNMVLSECSIVFGDPNTALFVGDGRAWSIMGSDIHSTSPSFAHTCRFWSANRYYVKHNRIWGATNSLHFLKLHSAGTSDYPANDQRNNPTFISSVYNVIGQNNFAFSGGTLLQGVALAPEANDLPAQGVSDCIVEDNYFYQQNSTDIALGGRRLTARGNLGNGFTPSTATSVKAGASGSVGIPSGWDGPYYTGGASVTVDPPR